MDLVAGFGLLAFLSVVHCRLLGWGLCAPRGDWNPSQPELQVFAGFGGKRYEVQRLGVSLRGLAPLWCREH